MLKFILSCLFLVLVSPLFGDTLPQDRIKLLGISIDNTNPKFDPYYFTDPLYCYSNRYKGFSYTSAPIYTNYGAYRNDYWYNGFYGHHQYWNNGHYGYWHNGFYGFGNYWNKGHRGFSDHRRNYIHHDHRGEYRRGHHHNGHHKGHRNGHRGGHQGGHRK